MQQNEQYKKVPFGISLPKKLLDSIDQERGDIPRSRFILRLLENVVFMTRTNDSSSASGDRKLGKKIKIHNINSKFKNEYSTNAVKNSVTMEKIRRPVDQSFEASDQLGSTANGDNRT